MPKAFQERVEASWDHLQKDLEARGHRVKPKEERASIQKQVDATAQILAAMPGAPQVSRSKLRFNPTIVGLQAAGVEGVASQRSAIRTHARMAAGEASSSAAGGSVRSTSPARDDPHNFEDDMVDLSDVDMSVDPEGLFGGAP